MGGDRVEIEFYMVFFLEHIRSVDPVKCCCPF